MTWYPDYYPYWPPPRPPRRWRWGYALLAVLLMAALAALVVVAVVTNHTSQPDPERSYQVGHNEVGPVASLVILEHPEDNAQNACTLATVGWVNDWDNGRGIHTSTHHSGPPSWWDVEMVQRGCEDYINNFGN